MTSKNRFQKAFDPEHLKKRHSQPYRSFTHITWMKVTAIDPATNTLSVAALGGIKSGASSGGISNVKCLGFSLGTDFGHVDFSQPDVSTLSDPNSPDEGGIRDSYALIGFIEDHIQMPVCLGYINPTKSQMYFTEQDFSCYRHASGLYRFIDQDGNMEFVHPSGLYFRIGTGFAPTDMSTKQASKTENPDVQPWKVPLGSATPNPNLTIHHPNGTSIVLQADPVGQEKVIVASKSGHLVTLDDTAGSEAVSIIHKLGTLFQMDPTGSLQLISTDGSQVTLSVPDGTLTVADTSGNTLYLNNGGITFTDYTGNLVIFFDSTNGNIQITSNQNVVVSSPNVTLDAESIGLGTSAPYSAVLGELLAAYIDAQIIPGLTLALSTLGLSPSPIPTPIPSSVWNLNPVTSWLSGFIGERSNLF